jgi:hypothetical protein
MIDYQILNEEIETYLESLFFKNFTQELKQEIYDNVAEHMLTAGYENAIPGVNICINFIEEHNILVVQYYKEDDSGYIEFLVRSK